MKKTLLLLLAITLSTPFSMLHAEGESEAATDKAPATETTNVASDLLKTFTDRIEIHGYAQGGYDYNTTTNENSFSFKRTVVWAKAKITDQWSFLFMHDFNSKPLEYYTDYRPHKAIGFRIGQFKNSFSLENPLSPSKVELIDICAQGVTWLTGGGTDPLFGKHTGRDLGLLIYGEPFKGFAYEFGVMNGQGINNRDLNKSKDMLLKLTAKPCDQLSIVASGQIGHGHAIADSEFNPYVREGDNYRRHRIAFGANYTTAPLSIRAEYLKGWDGPVQSQGAYATATVNLLRKLDAVASYDYFDRNTRGHFDQTNYTLGLQYWFFNKCRLQAQWTFCDPDSHWKKNYNMLQFQTQICF